MHEQAHKTHFIGDLAFAPVAVAYLYSSRFGKGDGNLRHQHNTLEVCLVTGGVIEWQFGEKGLTAKPGQVVIVGPHIAHGSSDEVLYPCEYIALQIYMNQLSIEGGALDALAGTHAAFSGEEVLELAVREVFKEHKSRTHVAKDVVKRWCELICLYALRGKPLAEVAPPASGLVVEAQSLLLRRQTDSMNASQAARELGVSAAWLVSKFKEDTGLPPAEWLRFERTKQASSLLAETTQSISDIARGLGFPTSQFFSSFFKKETGLTPSEYRGKAAARSQREGEKEVVQVYY